MREQFEKLPEIADNLHNVIFDAGSGEYLPKKMGYIIHEFSAYFLNGALYAFQEQQKKIDAVLRFLSGYDSIDIENSVNLRDCVNEIEELLK